MKLRNKKTGEIFTLDNIVNDKGEKVFCFDNVPDGYELTGVPLIKDEKIRKAVRAWAKANVIRSCICKEEMHCITFETERGMFISFEYADPIPPEGNYTIAELCGEEE